MYKEKTKGATKRARRNLRAGIREPKKNCDGTLLQENDEVRIWGGIEPPMTKKYKLTPDTTPEDYMAICLPDVKNPWSTKKKEWLSIRFLTKWMNLKAELAGVGDTCYPD